MWKYYAILSAFFAALTAILAKLGIKGISGNLATAIRTVVILFIAWGIVIGMDQLKELRTLTRTNVLFLIFSGVATGLSWIFYFKALETGDVSKVAPLDKMSVPIAIALAFFVLREPVDLKTMIGGVLILGGAILMVW